MKVRIYANPAEVFHLFVSEDFRFSGLISCEKDAAIVQASGVGILELLSKLNYPEWEIIEELKG